MNSNELLNEYDKLAENLIKLKIKRLLCFVRCFNHEMNSIPASALEKYEDAKRKFEILVENELELRNRILRITSIPIVVLLEHKKSIQEEVLNEEKPFENLNHNIKVISTEYENIDGIIQSNEEGIYLSRRVQDSKKVLANRNELIKPIIDNYIKDEIKFEEAFSLITAIDKAYGIMYLDRTNENLLDMLNDLDLDFDNKKEL